jgi:hypothetical protein
MMRELGKGVVSAGELYLQNATFPASLDGIKGNEQSDYSKLQTEESMSQPMILKQSHTPYFSSVKALKGIVPGINLFHMLFLMVLNNNYYK